MQPSNSPIGANSAPPMLDGTEGVTRIRFAQTVIEWAKQIQRAALVLMVLLIGVSLTLLLAVLAFAYLKNQTLGEQLASVRPAGIVQSIHLPDSFWGHALVETSTGWYTLADGVSLNKGDILTLERYANNDRYLCDSEHYCVELARSFLRAGPTIPNRPAHQK